MSLSNWATAPKRVITNLPWAEVVSIKGSLILLNLTPNFSNWSTSFKRCEMLSLMLHQNQQLRLRNFQFFGVLLLYNDKAIIYRGLLNWTNPQIYFKPFSICISDPALKDYRFIVIVVQLLSDHFWSHSSIVSSWSKIIFSQIYCAWDPVCDRRGYLIFEIIIAPAFWLSMGARCFRGGL